MLQRLSDPWRLRNVRGDDGVFVDMGLWVLHVLRGNDWNWRYRCYVEW